jgi:orotate phosphoribosyltransferase
MSELGILEKLRTCDALLDGHFELRSGLHSNQFFQCANLLRYPRVAGSLCEELVSIVPEEHRAADMVVSPALGGILVGHEIARVLDLPHVFVEKQDGKLVMRRFAIEPGARYIVAEDVITRGGRVQETVDIVRGAGAEVVSILLLVDRSGGEASFDVPRYSLLQMAPVVHEPEACPMCAGGEPLVHPGS